MSKYTTEVRWICESLNTDTEHKDPFNVVDNTYNKVFNFSFPFYNDVAEDKVNFEKQFLLYYYTREISEETVALWKLRLQTQLTLIMPYYVELYKTIKLEFNPLFDVDYYRENNANKTNNNNYTTDYTYTPEVETTISTDTDIEDLTNTVGINNTMGNIAKKAQETDKRKENINTNRNRNDNATSSENGSYSDWDLFSDTPQGAITGVENATDNDVISSGNSAGDLVRDAYLTDARHKFGENENSKTDAATSKENTSGLTSSEQEHDITEITQQNNSERNNQSSISKNKGNTTSTTSYEGENRTKTEHDANFNEGRLEKEHIYGKSNNSTYTKLIKEYRENILNLNRMIIEELSILFFGLW